jgi:molybdopterin synthase catalytic subunit
MSAGMGAAVYFLGVVREAEQGRKISAIDYEAFHKMALHQFHLVFDQVAKQWPVESVRLVHRVGRVAVGEASLWIEVVAPHREEAFAACQFIISEMKRVVPIWKSGVA